MIRTGRYSPLRYPGGKGKLSGLLKAIISENGLLDGTYVEPFAGGAGLACELLAENYVRQVHINDVSSAIYSFWTAALRYTARFCDDIDAIPVTTLEWGRQKRIFEQQRRLKTPDIYELGFSTFYLNRTNRSGILNGGMIGGKAQASAWGLDARFNKADLIKRIELLAEMRDRIEVTNFDAMSLLDKYRRNSPYKTLIYLDPPYFEKGRQLYLDYYNSSDHRDIAFAVQETDQPFNWLVSYDNVQDIKELYINSRALEYDINYSARSASTGSEVIFFDPNLSLPDFNNFVSVTKSAA